jgi:hypothetical protein
MAITVDAGDGRIIEFPDVETANKFFASQGKANEAKPERSFGDMLYENIIGSGEVDTPGERLGQLIRGAGAATARGIADVPALPANLLQLAASGYEKLTGAEEPSAVSRALEALPDTREMLAAVPVIGPESQYVAPGTAGKYISTIGEFAGGAGLSAGPKAMIKYGAVPGAASEAAGQATEGTAAEPYARMAGALAAPIAVGALQKGIQKTVSPMAGEISPARQKAVEVLRSEGIEPTSGQIIGGKAAENQLYREAATAAGRAKADEALGGFTAAVMRRIGSSAGRATPEALVEADSRIGSVFQDVLSGVRSVPSKADQNAMKDVLKIYRDLAPKDSAIPILANIRKRIVSSVKSNKGLPAETLKEWRTSLSALTKSKDPATRKAAIGAIDVIDDMSEKALQAAGRGADAQKLAEARNQYRNLLAIEQAAARADIEGILSPLQLRTALLTQGRRRYVQGKGDLAELTKAAADILKPLPQSGTAPRISATQIMPSAAGGTGVGLGAVGLGVDPVTATVLGGIAAMTPSARNAFLSSSAGQRYIANQLMGPAGPVFNRQIRATLPGLLSDE